MGKLIKIAFRNLYRQQRRSLLTIAIISVGVIAVLLFSALSDAFKNIMIGQITDSMLGHMQIHKKGYVSSLDNLPLDKVISAKQMKKIGEVLSAHTGTDKVKGHRWTCSVQQKNKHVYAVL